MRNGDLSAASRRSLAVPFVAIGLACIVAGGLIAGLMARRASEAESWAVAFLVLVSGVAQMAVGVGQASLATAVPRRAVVALQLVAYNAGCALVLLGTLADRLVLTDAGGAALALALVLLLLGVRPADAHARWPVHVYRLLIVIVLVSIPVGLVLARVRAT